MKTFLAIWKDLRESNLGSSRGSSLQGWKGCLCRKQESLEADSDSLHIYRKYYKVNQSWWRCTLLTRWILYIRWLFATFILIIQVDIKLWNMRVRALTLEFKFYRTYSYGFYMKILWPINLSFLYCSTVLPLGYCTIDTQQKNG